MYAPMDTPKQGFHSNRSWTHFVQVEARKAVPNFTCIGQEGCVPIMAVMLDATCMTIKTKAM